MARYLPLALCLAPILWIACILDPSMGIALCRAAMLLGASCALGLAALLPFIISDHRAWMRGGPRSCAGQPWQANLPSLSAIGRGYSARYFSEASKAQRALRADLPAYQAASKRRMERRAS